MNQVKPDDACIADANDTNNKATSNAANKKKRGRRKTRNERFKEQKKVRVDYTPIVKENQALIAYYKSQNLVNEEDFESVFLEELRTTLPASFRINTFDAAQAVFLRSHIEGPIANKLNEYVMDNTNKKEDESDKQENPTLTHASIDPLVWYPKRLAWQMNITRLDLRKIPVLQLFHQFLMAETDSGFISRQESVSMIPPLLLDIKKGNNILDVCAAPGSKTAQLLEYLKSGMLSHDEQPLFTEERYPKGLNDGMVVANDVDNKRCYMLVHQSNRLNSPNCVIINEDASKMSSIKYTDDQGNVQNLKFDRILCDVPCSGDGTIRKNPDVWKKWTVGNGNNFHGLQSKILRRSLQLLKKDGLLVYSTCSMNPIEDEAVVASVLRSSKGGIVLEKAAERLPGLKHLPGLTKWVVMDKEMNIIPNFEKVPEEKVSYTYPSLFPPKPEELLNFNLDRCIRILPHMQNTGGFFVALIRKVVDKLPDELDEEKKKNEEACFDEKPKQEKRKRYGGFKEDAFLFVEEDDPDWISIKNSFGFRDDFPVNQLVHRCVSGNKRSIYLVSKDCRNFILSNQEMSGRKEFVKIINAGMRLFSRSTIAAGYRVCQDGINEVLPYMKDDLKIEISQQDLVPLIKFRNVKIDSLNEDLKTSVSANLKTGSFVLLFNHSLLEGTDSIEAKLPLVAWKGEVCISLYVSDKFRVHLAAITGIDLSETCIKDKKF